jgi:hypothetical protein
VASSENWLLKTGSKRLAVIPYTGSSLNLNYMMVFSKLAVLKWKDLETWLFYTGKFLKPGFFIKQSSGTWFFSTWKFWKAHPEVGDLAGGHGRTLQDPYT